MAVQLTSAAHLLLYDDSKLLMTRRYQTGYEDGSFSVVAGHLEPDETARTAMQREAKEEANIDVQVGDLEFVHVMHRHSNGENRTDFFFSCTKWSGTVGIAEPHKCDLMEWYPQDALPSNTVPYVRAALTHVRHGRRFSEFGWPGSAD